MTASGARIASTLAGALVVVAVLLAHRDEAARALSSVAPAVLVATVLLHVAVLALRAEIWGATLAAIEGRRLPRGTLHSATSMGALAGVLSSHLTLATRVAVVRRRAPREAPSPGQLVLTDAPLLALEATCAALLAPIAVAGLPAWAMPLPLLAVLAALLGLRLAHGRFSTSRLAAGLAVLADRRGRRRVAASACSRSRSRCCGCSSSSGRAGWPPAPPASCSPTSPRACSACCRSAPPRALGPR